MKIELFCEHYLGAREYCLFRKYKKENKLIDRIYWYEKYNFNEDRVVFELVNQKRFGKYGKVMVIK